MMEIELHEGLTEHKNQGRSNSSIQLLITDMIYNKNTI